MEQSEPTGEEILRAGLRSIYRRYGAVVHVAPHPEPLTPDEARQMLAALEEQGRAGLLSTGSRPAD